MAKNASNPGGTVVQLYFSQSAAQAVRPKLMLLAFAKVDRATTDLVRSLTSLPWRFTRHDTVSVSQLQAIIEADIECHGIDLN